MLAGIWLFLWSGSHRDGMIMSALRGLWQGLDWGSVIWFTGGQKNVKFSGDTALLQPFTGPAAKKVTAVNRLLASSSPKSQLTLL